MILLSVVGVATTIPRFRTAFSKLLLIDGLTSVDLSKSRVYMRLVIIVLKVSRIVVLLISTKAFGTTDNTRCFPSATIKANNGATTLVLPAPMIICFTFDLSLFKHFLKSLTISTCFFLSCMFHINSKTRYRGS